MNQISSNYAYRNRDDKIKSRDLFFEQIAVHPLLNKTQETRLFTKLDTALKDWLAHLLYDPSLRQELKKAFKKLNKSQDKSLENANFVAVKFDLLDKSGQVIIEAIRHSYPCYAKLANLTERYLNREPTTEKFHDGKLSVAHYRTQLGRYRKLVEALINRIAHCNLRLVTRIAHEHNFLNLPIMDVVQEGNLGLLKAIEKYRLDRKTRFSTYAWWWIKQQITYYVRRQGGIVRKPDNVVDKLYEVNKLYKKNNQGNQRDWLKFASNNTDYSRSEISRLMQLTKPDLSFEQTNQNDEGLNLNGQLTTNDAPLDEALFNYKSLNNNLAKLPERLKTVVIFRFGLFGSETLTFREVAKLINVSPERARQLEKQALEELKVLIGDS